MRILSFLFFGLFALGLILWVLFYTFAVSLACAYGSPSGQNCSKTMPWDMRGDDLLALVIFPAVGLLVLLIFAILFRRLARKTT